MSNNWQNNNGGGNSGWGNQGHGNEWSPGQDQWGNPQGNWDGQNQQFDQWGNPVDQFGNPLNNPRGMGMAGGVMGGAMAGAGMAAGGMMAARKVRRIMTISIALFFIVPIFIMIIIAASGGFGGGPGQNLTFGVAGARVVDSVQLNHGAEINSAFGHSWVVVDFVVTNSDDFSRRVLTTDFGLRFMHGGQVATSLTPDSFIRFGDRLDSINVMGGNNPHSLSIIFHVPDSLRTNAEDLEFRAFNKVASLGLWI